MKNQIENFLINKFTSLISTNTQSDYESKTYPSTEAQIYFAEMLANECVMLGLEDVKVDKNCYVTAVLPANTNEEKPVVGFIAHMDTSPDFSGLNIVPNIIDNYSGEDIKLKNNITISPNEFPSLKKYIGKKLITADGTTLLGADDKAGISEILTAMHYLITNPEIKHGKIKIAFTPDEEVGRGVDYFNVKDFGCDFAYTIDGGELGELNYETFNAARAKIAFEGRNIHPGTAKDIMINASLAAMEFNALLPSMETPSHTSSRQGFYHLIHISGDVESANAEYIIRDFEKDAFEKRKQNLLGWINSINNSYNKEIAKIEIHDEYYNMAEILKERMDIIDIAKKAMQEAGIEPIVLPIRGGTDGSRLSFDSLPCPNIFTGGHNFHGPYEFICVDSMIKAVEVIINIAKSI